MIRNYKSSDRNWVTNSWLRSFEGTKCAGVWASTNDYRAHYEPLARAYLADPAVTTLVRCNPDDEDQDFAWLMHRGRTLIYLYVKQIFRDRPDSRLRYARSLLEHAGLLGGEPIVVAFWTPAWHRYADRYRIAYRHEPDGEERAR